MQQKIEASNADYIIITDVRFDNEAEFVKKNGGKIIKIIILLYKIIALL